MGERVLVLGTHNRKKGQELAALLAPHGFRILTLVDVSDPLTVDETGTSFAENAAKKACEQAKHLQHWVIGEDSGLCVDALHGAPGVYSARYSGATATDESNNQRLLRELVQEQQRRGATIIFSTHVMHQAEQICDHVVMIHDGLKVLDESLTDIRTRFDPRTILVEPLQPDADVSRLDSLPGVTSLNPLNGSYEIGLADGHDPATAMRDIVSALPVARVELHRPSLEDVFVTIPQPNLRARVQQAFGNSAANALGRTSDDGHFAVQFDLVHAKSPLFLRGGAYRCALSPQAEDFAGLIDGCDVLTQ